MKRISIPILLLVAATAALAFTIRLSAQSGLTVTYGDQGVAQLSYNGLVLEDVGQNASDAFHIWHMKATDLNGNLLSQGQYGWGEVNNGRNWNAATHTWTYTFTWGSISVAYAQSGDSLNMTVNTTNLPGSGIIFDGATIYPLVLRFPQPPKGFANPPIAQLADNTTAPSLTLADYTKGEVGMVVPDASKPLYSGFQPAGSGNTYTALISSTAPDNLATFLPHNDRPVPPGASDTEIVSLRFAPTGTSLTTLAGDVYQAWSSTHLPTLHWKDRRIVGSVYLASSPQGDPATPAGYPSNPRRYFNNSNASDFDIRTPAGLQAFQARILQQAANNVQNLERLGAQGAITWDIEGEQYPQPTSYACAPDQVGTLAPEMESIVANQNSPYNGMKLDDAYFRTMHDAGFRVGLCVRPQHFTVGADGRAQQVSLSDDAVVAELVRKMKYAHDRWGATLFYVDSSVEADGATLSADLFKQVAIQLPDSLIVPEESTAQHYAYTAPFKSFIFHTDLGTDSSVYNSYPGAFSLNLINDVNPAKLAQYMPQLTAAVRHGDILMVHADYWQANNPVVVQIYQAAAAK